SAQSVIYAEAVETSVLGYFVEIAANELFFLDKLDILQTISGQLDGLVEAILAAIRHVHNFYHFGLKARIEHVRSAQLGLEISRAGQHQACHIAFVVCQKNMGGGLGHFAQVVVTLFHAQAGETHRRLATTAVFFWQFDSELCDYVPGVALEGAKKGPVAIHDDKAEFGVVGQEGRQRLDVEFVVTKVKRGVDGLERLEVNVDFFFLAIFGHDFATVDDEAVRRHLVVELEASLDRCKCCDHRLAGYPRFDVGGCAQLVGDFF
ncbi:hypothetical protein BpHYR1_020023, partial [Brachionus plicatilis]